MDIGEIISSPGEEFCRQLIVHLLRYRWIDYHPMSAEQEKEYIARQLTSLQQTTGSVPVGWYYGRLSPRSRALVHEVYEEMGHSLLYESDAYDDDLPHWVDVPAERDSPNPKGMLLIPYT